MAKKQKKQEALSVSRLINEVLVAQLSIPFRQIVNDTTFSKILAQNVPTSLFLNLNTMAPMTNNTSKTLSHMQKQKTIARLKIKIGKML